MRSAESLLAPMLTPTMPPRPRRALSRASAAAWPSLLKPMRLMTASSSGRRNSRGLGFPACGFGVTVPISVKPKPSASMASGTSAFLSKPAARPSGLEKLRPKASTARRASPAGAWAFGNILSVRMVSRCAASASSRWSSGLARGKARLARLTRPPRPESGERRSRAAEASPRPRAAWGSRHRHAETGRRRARLPI